MVALIAIAVLLLSDNRKAINLRTVGGAFAINSRQFATTTLPSPKD
ncbi:hypothetical protein O9992_05475 [Vibrio lentus]|nr:hypothetical protein [Vibrio lentus]